MIDMPAFSRQSLAVTVLITGSLMLSACAVAAAQDGEAEDAEQAEEQSAREEGGRQCFFPRQVTGFRTVKDEESRRSDTRVLIDVRASDTFEVELMHRCPQIRWARSVGFSQSGAGRVCDGLDVDLIVPDPPLGPQRCRVVSIRKLAPGEPGARAGARE